MEENAESSIRSLILRDLNLQEVQFEIIKDSGVSDGSAVCIVSQLAYYYCVVLLISIWQ